MSIRSTIIARVADGLPLAASMDDGEVYVLFEIQRCIVLFIKHLL